MLLVGDRVGINFEKRDEERGKLLLLYGALTEPFWVSDREDLLSVNELKQLVK